MNAIMQNAHMSVARNFTKWQIADCAVYVIFILQIVVFVLFDILVEPYSMLYCGSPAAYSAKPLLSNVDVRYPREEGTGQGLVS